MKTYDRDRDDWSGERAGVPDEGAGYRQPFLRGSQFQRADGGRTGGGMNVGDTERWASIAAGVGMIALAARRRPLAALAVGTLGAGLIARGLGGHCPLYGATNRSSRNDTREALGGERGVHVHKVMTINRPIEEVYRFWRDLSNLPRVMKHLEAVTPLGNGRSHWVVRAPAGFRVEWDAEIINEEDNRVIGWRSLENADVVSAGSVTFRSAPVIAPRTQPDTSRSAVSPSESAHAEGAAQRGTTGGATEIAVRLQYEPPAGKLGALIASLFGEEPSQQIADDLRRVKAYLETGEIPTTEGQPAGRARKAQSEPRGQDAQQAPHVAAPHGEQGAHDARSEQRVS